MNNLLKSSLKILIPLAAIFTPLTALASSTRDTNALACGYAQIKANKCIKDQSSATTGVFGSLASKVTSSDMGKTAANQASSQTANLICKSDIENAAKLCQPQ